MKRTIFGLATMLVVFVAVFSVLVLRPVAKVKASQGCSNASLRGNYGLVAQGLFKGEAVTANFSMLAEFDGKGGFSGSSLNIIFEGIPSGDNPYTFTGGTYTVNSDCTCTLTTPVLAEPFEIVTAYGIVVDTGGDEVAGNWFGSSHATGTFDAKRVAIGRWVFLP